jgi:hypothetical protein
METSGTSEKGRGAKRNWAFEKGTLWFDLLTKKGDPYFIGIFKDLNKLLVSINISNFIFSL